MAPRTNPRTNVHVLALLLPWGAAHALALPLERRPFAAIVTPNHFQCLNGSSLVGNMHVEFAAPPPMPGETAFALDSDDWLCVSVDLPPSAQRHACARVRDRWVPQPSNLTPGCHTLLAWWESQDRTEAGVPHPVLVQVPEVPGGACHASCTAAAAPAPSHVTGGCLPSGPGDPGEQCCPLGCCEYTNLASRCSAFDDGLPPCATCMARNAPPRPGALAAWLPEPGRGAARAYLELVKAVVLNEVFSGPEAAGDLRKVDGHVWPAGDDQALSMVGRRRLDHVQALVEDVVLRSVPGDVAECGCWRGGVAALAAAVLHAAGELRRGAAGGSGGQRGEQIVGQATIEPSGGTSGGSGGTSSGGPSRVVWLLDSFSGLPPPDVASFPVDAAHLGDTTAANSGPFGAAAVQSGEAGVRAALNRLGLFDSEGTRQM